MRFLILSLLALAACAQRFANINEYISGSKLDYQGETFTTDWDTVSDDIKNLVVFKPPFLPAVTIGSLITGGEIKVKDLVCTDPTVLNEAEVRLQTSEERNGDNQLTKVKNSFYMNGISLDCRAEMDLSDADKTFIPNQFFFNILRPTSISDTLDVTMSIDFDMGATASYNYIHPTNVHLAENECTIGIKDEVIELENNGGLGDFILVALINVAIWLVPGILEGIVCGIVRQLGYYDMGDGPKSGIMNELLEEANKWILEQGSTNVPPADPEADELDFIAENPDRLEKFTDFSDSFPYEVTATLINDVLGAEANDSSRLVVNELFDRITETTDGRVEIYFEEDSLEIPVGDLAPGKNVVLSNGAVTLDHMNQITKLSLLRNPDKKYKYTLENDLTLKQFGVGTTSSVLIPDLLDRMPNVGEKTLDISLLASVAFGEPEVSFATLIAAEMSQLNNTHIGNVVDFEFSDTASVQTSLACLGQGLDTFNLTKLQITSDDIQIQVNGLIDPGFDDIISVVNIMTRSLFGPSIERHHEGFIASQMDTINEEAYQALQDQLNNGGVNSDCPTEYKGDPTRESLVDFTSPQVRNLKDSLDKTVADVNDPDFGINNIIRTLTGNLQQIIDEVNGGDGLSNEGRLYFGDIFSVTVPVDNKLVRVAINKAQLANLDSIFAFDVLNDVSPRRIQNRVGLGDPEPVKLMFNLEFDTDDAYGVDSDAIWKVELAYKAMEFNIGAEVEMDINKLYPLTFGDAQYFPCLLGIINELNIFSFNGTHDSTTLNLDCQGCSLGSRWKEDDAVRKMTEITNIAFAVMREAIGNEDAIEATNRIVQDIAATCYDGRNLTDVISLPTFQPTVPPPDVGATVVYITNAVVYGIVFFAVFLLFVTRTKSARLPPSKGSDASSSSRESEFFNINSMGPAMFFDPLIPAWFKILAPLISVTCIALLLSANLTNGGSVLAVVYAEDGQVIELGSLFDFTLTGSINDMWQAGVESLGLLIAVFSSCWPYVKIVLTMLAFFFPPRILSVSKRHKLLQLLDFLGKWSVVDQLMMALLIIVFNIEVEVSPKDNPEWFFAELIPEAFFTVTIRIRPEWGLYGFLVGAILSIFLGHAVMYFHNRIIDNAWHPNLDEHDPIAVKRAQANANRKLPLRLHPHERHLTNEQSRRLMADHTSTVAGSVMTSTGATLKGYKIKYSPMVGAIVLLGFNLVVIVFVAGSVLETFGYYFEGVGGIAIGWISEGDDTKKVSLLSAGGSIPNQALDAGETAGLILIQLLFLGITFVIPLIRVFVQAALWFVPLTLNDQKKLYRAVEALGAWSGPDVFLGAVLAAYLNIERFAQFMVKPYCTEIDTFLKDYGVASGLLTSDQATCFRVRPFIENSMIIMGLAVIMMSLLTNFVSSSCRGALEDREAAIKGCHNPYNVDPKTGISKRQLSAFCFGLSDMMLIRLGLMRPVLVMGQPEAHKRDYDEMSVVSGSPRWPQVQPRDDDNASVASSFSNMSEAIRLHNEQRKNNLKDDYMSSTNTMEIFKRQGTEPVSKQFGQQRVSGMSFSSFAHQSPGSFSTPPALSPKNSGGSLESDNPQFEV